MPVAALLAWDRTVSLACVSAFEIDEKVFVRLCYIYPIKCYSSPLDTQLVGVDGPVINSEIIVWEEELLEGFEYVIEHGMCGLNEFVWA